MGRRDTQEQTQPPYGAAAGGLAERMATYLAEHPRANDQTAPLWPSRKNGGGCRATGQRYAVPLDWSQSLAMGTLYDTILKPALEAIGLPASQRAHKAKDGALVPAVRGCGGSTTYATRSPCSSCRQASTSCRCRSG